MRMSFASEHGPWESNNVRNNFFSNEIDGVLIGKNGGILLIFLI